MLAVGAEMRTSAGHQDSSNRRIASAAGLPGAQVDTMLQLEEAANPIGIDIVGN